jgi:hypothetical protein
MLPRGRHGHSLQPHHCHCTAHGAQASASPWSATTGPVANKSTAGDPLAVQASTLQPSRAAATILATALVAGRHASRATPPEHATSRAASHRATSSHAPAAAAPTLQASTVSASTRVAAAADPAVASTPGPRGAAAAPDPSSVLGRGRRPGAHAGGHGPKHGACERQSANHHRLFGWGPPTRPV